MAGLAAVRYGRHVRGVRFEQQLVLGDQGGGIADALRTLEGDDAGKADKDVCVEPEERLGEFGSARKAVDVNLVVAEVGVPEHGEGVVVGFAEVQHQRLAALEPELQVSLEKSDLARGGIRIVMVVEAEFTARDAFGVREKLFQARFVFGSFGIDVFRMDTVGGVDVRVFFGEFPAAFEIRRIARHVDEGLGQRDVRVGVVGEPLEERVEGLAGVLFVGIDVAVRVDEHRGVGACLRHFEV